MFSMQKHPHIKPFESTQKWSFSGEIKMKDNNRWFMNEDIYQNQQIGDSMDE